MAKRSAKKKAAAAAAKALSVVSEQPQNLQSGDEIKQPSSMEPIKKKISKSNARARIDEATYQRILAELNSFRASSLQECKFTQRSKTERAFIHEHSRKMGMTSKSSGKGTNRVLSLYKTKKGTDELGKDQLGLLKFSEESKEALVNLFKQYPPCQDGLEKLKFNQCIITKKTTGYKGYDTFRKPLMNREAIAKEVKALSLRVKNDKNLKKINDKRSMLPIASYQDAILSEIENSQVVLISGETGCGKTTQVPQFLLDNMWKKGQACKIVCTQPRRISATSVAERVSEERGKAVGETVGYKIRLESKGGRNSSLMFCTNGILLHLLVSDGLAGPGQDSSKSAASSNLSELTHIVVDEIHERDHYSDFILAILRDMLPRYPHLRLVLMSATMDVERFSQYFGGCPVIKVPGFTYPVKIFYLEDVLSMLKSEQNCFDATLPSSSSVQQALTVEKKVALDEAINLAWSNDESDALIELISSERTSEVLNYQHSQTGVSPLMVFAAKGKVGDVCMLLSLGADCLLKSQDGRTALDWAKSAEQTEVVDAISIHFTIGPSNSKNIQMLVDNSKNNQMLVDKYLASVNVMFIDTVLIEQLLMKICVDSESGAILVFFSGWDDINKTKTRLLANSFFKDGSKFLILPLHSMVPSADQKKVFSRPPNGCRKIILSTNIAETAVTIDDVVFVIDSGRLKEKNYDPLSNVSTLQTSWVSKASAKQRAGRSGRCQPGFCYYLYTRLQAEGFPEFRTPEIKRMPIEELCLQVKMLDPSYNIGEFLNKTLDPPVSETINNAVSLLKEIGALSNEENLTQLGKQLGSLPVNPLTSRMLFFAILFNCLDPALTLACASYYRDPFTLPMSPEDKAKANNAKAELAALYGGHSEQLAVIAAFECWSKAKKKSLQAEFCKEFFLSFATMNMLSCMRRQLQRELLLLGYIPDLKVTSCNQNAREPNIINALLVAGLYPNVGRVTPSPKAPKNLYMETASGNRIRIPPYAMYPLSPLKASSGDTAIIVYSEMTQGDAGLQVKKCSLIGNIPLLLVANEIAVAPTKDKKGDGDGGKRLEGDKEEIPSEEKVMSSADDPVVLIVDRWLSFKCTALEVAQIYCLRERLSAAISFKGINPRKAVPPAVAATISTITCIFKHDEQSRIPLATEYPPTSYLKSLFSPKDDDRDKTSSVSQGAGKRTRPLNKSNPKRLVQPLPRAKSAASTPNMQQQQQQQQQLRTVQSGSAPENLHGYGSGVFGPYGTHPLSRVQPNRRAQPNHRAPPPPPPASAAPRLPAQHQQKPRTTVQTVPTPPETLSGYGSGVFGPFGPRGPPSKKRSRSGR